MKVKLHKCDFQVCSDTVGTLATAAEAGGIVLISFIIYFIIKLTGGIVLIAGTGSNALLINSDG